MEAWDEKDIINKKEKCTGRRNIKQVDVGSAYIAEEKLYRSWNSFECDCKGQVLGVVITARRDQLFALASEYQ